jgi:hypothetical protein
MGFNYRRLDGLDHENHKVIGGNHDNYHCEGTERIYVAQSRHFLGDFGVHTVPGWGELFYVRGSMSIDRKWRTHGVDWWPAEELTTQEGAAALALYEEVMPDFMVTHDCPTSVVNDFSTLSDDALFRDFGVVGPSTTSKLLELMLDIYRPKTWVFGHYHNQKTFKPGMTEFICLDELLYRDFDPLGSE